MPIFGRRTPSPPPAAPPPARLNTNTPSPVVNVIGRGLNAALRQEEIVQIRSQSVIVERSSSDAEVRRAFLALDWLVRGWVPQWSLLLAGPGEQLFSILTQLAPIRDYQTAEAAGKFIVALTDIPEDAEKVIKKDYDKDSFYDAVAVGVASAQSQESVASSGGAAFADGAASVILEEFLAARMDVALRSVPGVALLSCLDGVWPYIQEWANRPGDFDAKKLSINGLAPAAARKVLEPTIKPLRQKSGQLYGELCGLI